MTRDRAVPLLALFLLVAIAACVWLRAMGLWPIRVGYVAAQPYDPYVEPHGETWR